MMQYVLCSVLFLNFNASTLSCMMPYGTYGVRVLFFVHPGGRQPGTLTNLPQDLYLHPTEPQNDTLPLIQTQVCTVASNDFVPNHSYCFQLTLYLINSHDDACMRACMHACMHAHIPAHIYARSCMQTS